MLGLLILLLVQAFAQPAPPIPTLPQTFQTDYTFSLDILNGGAPFFGGRFALDYVGLGGYWSFEDYTSSYVPFLLQTALIGVPYKGQSLLQGYTFLEIGRCWKIDKLSEEDFHQWALAIPPGAQFTGNTTINGYLTGVWTYNPYNIFSATMFVRYGDNAPLRFVLQNSLFFSFTATLDNYRFQPSVDPAMFATPAGPCPEHSFTSSFRELFSFESIKKVVSNLFLSQNLFTNLFGHGTGLKRNLIEEPVKRRSAPAPPVLNQYFSAEYVVGWGTLVADNKFQQPNNIFKGFMAVDKQAGGLYYNIRDNQDGNVPWMFSTSFITHPSPDNVTAYEFLSPGRCWTVGAAINPDIPLKIPDDATWLMDTMVYGKQCEIWQFPYDSEYGEITVQLAVDIKNSTLVFMNGGADIEFGNPQSYAVFYNWNSTRPDPSFYALPPGPCPNMFPSNEDDN